MKISFVIVALNAEKVLPISLSSLVAQDYDHALIEVILVDGCSSDGSKELMLDFQRMQTSFDRVVVLDNPGKYLACGWNVALREVTGDVVLRVDAHTRFDSDFISKNVNDIARGECICGGKVISILENDTEWGKTILEAENSMFGGGFTFFRRGEVEKYTDTLAFAAYKKEVFDKVGSYNEKLVRTEDNEMHYRMRKAGYKFFFDPQIVSYRYCRSSLSKLLRQKYLNGYWVGLTMYVEPKAFSLFYLVPLAFVLAIAGCVILLPLTSVPLLLLAIGYGFVLLLSLVAAIKKNGFSFTMLLLPFILLALHVAYGAGTLVGLLNKKRIK